MGGLKMNKDITLYSFISNQVSVLSAQELTVFQSSGSGFG